MIIKVMILPFIPFKDDHVTISGNVFGEIWQFLKGDKDRKCKVY